MITDPMKMTLQIPSSLPLQSFHPIMKLSFNLWELSLIYVVKRPYILNKMVRKQREKYLPDFPWSLRRIKPIHHIVPGNPIERRNMSHNHDNCECFNCAIHILQEQVQEQTKIIRELQNLNDQLH
jgi:hypothetical protein